MEGTRGEKRSSSSEDVGQTPSKVQAIGRGQSEPKMKEAKSPGDEFELTADMMVNDFDDERTLDEEEALEETDDTQNELSNLEKEKDMPMEVLLAMYGYTDGEEDDGNESSSSDEMETEKGSAKKLADKPEEESKSKQRPQENKSELPVDDTSDKTTESDPSLLQELYRDDITTVPAARNLRSGSRQHSEEEEEEEEDGEYSPEEDDWKKTIMVGADFQAVIPETLSKYDDAMPYENEDKLLWDPSVDETVVKVYLHAVQEIQGSSSNGVNSIPRGAHSRDDEQALYLLHQCGNNVEEAIRRQKINATSSSTSLWSEEECRNFETGLRQYGKDFYLTHQHRVRTRSVGELVQFYYLWKKTERHDVFANKARLEKKKYTLHPGTTDFMEKYLDEQEQPVTVPNCHSLLAGDPKRQARTTPPLANAVEPEHVNSVESRIISTRLEDIAKHLDKGGAESLVKLAGSD